MPAPAQHGLAKVHFHPMVDIDGTYGFQRLPNQGGRQVGEEGRNRQHEFPDLLERSPGRQAFVFPKDGFDDVGGGQPGVVGWDLGGFHLDLGEDLFGEAGGARGERGLRCQPCLKRFADALVETFGFENGLNVLGLGHHLGVFHQVIPILQQPGEALEKAAASTLRVVPEGLVEVVDRELGMGVQGLAKRRFIGVTAADDGAQGLRRCGTAACAQVLPSRPVQDALRLDRAEVTPIMIGEQALCPLHVGIQVHEARLGALARRQQEREVALLPGRQGRAAVCQERIPAGVWAQFALE